MVRIERLFFDSGLAHFIGWAFAYAFLWIQELSLTFTWDSWMFFGNLFISLVSTWPRCCFKERESVELKKGCCYFQRERDKEGKPGRHYAGPKQIYGSIANSVQTDQVHSYGMHGNSCVFVQ